MSSPDRTEILRRAKEAFLKHGRGFLILMADRDDPHYSFQSEIEAGLRDDPDAKGLLAWIGLALETYRPETEAVVVEERPDGLNVLVIREGGTTIVGGLTLSEEH